jgi:hypothetical protein
MRGSVFGETVYPNNRILQKRNRREVVSGSYVMGMKIYFNMYFKSFKYAVYIKVRQGITSAVNGS